MSDTVPLQAADVSAHGVFVRSAHVAPVRAALHLVLHLPDGPLESVATVIRALPGVGMGCHISIPGAEQRQRWQGSLDALMPRELILDDVVLEHPRDLFDFEMALIDNRPCSASENRSPHSVDAFRDPRRDTRAHARLSMADHSGVPVLHVLATMLLAQVPAPGTPSSSSSAPIEPEVLSHCGGRQLTVAGGAYAQSVHQRQQPIQAFVVPGGAGSRGADGCEAHTAHGAVVVGPHPRGPHRASETTWTAATAPPPPWACRSVLPATRAAADSAPHG